MIIFILICKAYAETIENVSEMLGFKVFEG